MYFTSVAAGDLMKNATAELLALLYRYTVQAHKPQQNSLGLLQKNLKI